MGSLLPWHIKQSTWPVKATSGGFGPFFFGDFRYIFFLELFKRTQVYKVSTWIHISFPLFRKGEGGGISQIYKCNKMGNPPLSAATSGGAKTSQHSSTRPAAFQHWVCEDTVGTRTFFSFRVPRDSTAWSTWRQRSCDWRSCVTWLRKLWEDVNASRIIVV